MARIAYIHIPLAWTSREAGKRGQPQKEAICLSSGKDIILGSLHVSICKGE